MSESRTFVFPENGNSGGGTNGILAMLPALMQQRGVDPNILALMGNGNSRNGNGWGDDLFAILLLFILMGWGGMGGFGGARGGMMGNGQGGVVPFVQNDANTAVIMQAVQRNGYDIQSLCHRVEHLFRCRTGRHKRSWHADMQHRQPDGHEHQPDRHRDHAGQ